jgi:lauroyl/myristoyl acyltransferase
VARPVHAPTTGPFRRLLGRFYFTGVFWYRFHLWGVGFLREWAIPPVVLFFTTVFYLALGRVRRAVDANLTLVLGPAGLLERQRRVFRTLHSFAWCLTERYEQFVPGKSFEFVKTDEHHYLELLARKSGVLVATAHVGCWELGSSIPAEYEGRVMNLIRELELDSEAQDFVRGLIEARADGRYRTHFASDDPTLGFELLDALQRGEMVALPVDRPRRAGRVSRQKLFGKEFDLPIGPVVLARAAGVPILPVFTLREGRRRYRIVFREPIVVVAMLRTRRRARRLRSGLWRSSWGRSRGWFGTVRTSGSASRASAEGADWVECCARSRMCGLEPSPGRMVRGERGTQGPLMGIPL